MRGQGDQWPLRPAWWMSPGRAHIHLLRGNVPGSHNVPQWHDHRGQCEVRGHRSRPRQSHIPSTLLTRNVHDAHTDARAWTLDVCWCEEGVDSTGGSEEA